MLITCPSDLLPLWPEEGSGEYGGCGSGSAGSLQLRLCLIVWIAKAAVVALAASCNVAVTAAVIAIASLAVAAANCGFGFPKPPRHHVQAHRPRLLTGTPEKAPACAWGGLGRDVPVSQERCPGLPDHLQKMDRRNNLHNDSSLKFKTQKFIFFKKSYCVGCSVGGTI